MIIVSCYNINQQISYSLDDNTGDIVLYDITTSKLIAFLVCSTPSTSISIRGVWLAAAQETAGDVVFVSEYYVF